MNSKYRKMALPGVVIGLALGLIVPAAAFAQDDQPRDHHRGGRGGGDAAVQTRSDTSSDTRSYSGDRGQRGGFVGARTQTGAAVDPSVNATGSGHPGWGDRGGDRGDRGSWGGGSRNDATTTAATTTNTRSGGNWGGNRGGTTTTTDTRTSGSNWNGGNRGGGSSTGGWGGGINNDRHDDRRGDDRQGGDRGSTNWGGSRGGSNWGNNDRRADSRDRDDRHRDDRGGRGRFDWHNDQRFHDYSGVRLGFYFAPGHGYYRVPDQWYGHHWGRGEYLPRYFFSYRISDPDYYGLPYPPYGCAWFFVGEDAVLIDLDTGEIVDVVYEVF